MDAIEEEASKTAFCALSLLSFSSTSLFASEFISLINF
jgi:hypothetical protein